MFKKKVASGGEEDVNMHEKEDEEDDDDDDEDDEDEEEDDDEEHDDGDGNETDDAKGDNKRKIYIPGVSRPLQEGEEWEFDPEAYRLFHSFETKYPCLSFDTIVDSLGDGRSDFPMSCYLVAGTQAEQVRRNRLIVMRLSNLYGIESEKSDSESDDDDESDNEENEEKPKTPRLHAAFIEHHGGINRMRVANIGDSRVAAVWNDQAKVQLWNLNDGLKEINEMDSVSKSIKLPRQTPLFSFVGHRDEGFALAWSPLALGSLSSGDNKSNIYYWHMAEGGRWIVDNQPLIGHTKSIEDLAWSPTESSLMVSCSGDRSIKLWDTRSPSADACVCTVANAHEGDVNVVSWNKQEPLLVTGGDDATLRVWSLKTIQYGQPVARFKHHKGPITSVEWCPHEATTILASGEDDQTTIWDLAVEAELDEENLEVPPQLLFVHMGQKEIKEVHWHSQIPGLAITTAITGFNVFRTISV